MNNTPTNVRQWSLEDKAIIEKILGFPSPLVPSDKQIREKLVLLMRENSDTKEIHDVLKTIYDRFFMYPPSELGKRSLKEMSLPPNTKLPPTAMVVPKPIVYEPQKYMSNTYTCSVTVDSNLRTNKQKSNASDFVFTLSNIIKNVKKLNVTSVSIPYTWNVVSRNYGSNIFILRNNLIGMDNGDYDFIITVPPGNYNAKDLWLAINEQINVMTAANHQVDFTGTELLYDAPTSRITLIVYMKQVFHEQDYLLTLNPALKTFLGFEHDAYTMSSIYSARTVPITNNNSQFILTEDNNYFNVIMYLNSSTEAFEPVVIPVRLSLDLNVAYGRLQLLTNISEMIRSNPMFDPDKSSMLLVQNSTNSFLGQYILTLNLQPSNSNYKVSAGLKVRVEFPDESSTTDQSSRIWTGISSCFRFPQQTAEISEIYSEQATTQTNFTVQQGAKIEFECIKTNYIGEDNNFSLVIPPSITPYTVDQYMEAITTSFAQEESNNFNLAFCKAFQDSTTNKFNLQVDISRSFDESMFDCTVDANSPLKQVMNVDGGNVTITYPDENSIRIAGGFARNGGGYVVDSDSLATPLFTLTPKSGITSPSYDVYLTGKLTNSNTIIYSDANKMKEGILSSIKYSDNSGNVPFINTTLVLGDPVVLPNGVNRIGWTLIIKLQYYLTEDDYEMKFTDDSGDSSWLTNLRVVQDENIRLSTLRANGATFVTFVAPDPIIGGDLFKTTSDTTLLTITPLSSIPTLLDGSISLSLPTNTIGYTRDALLSNLNTLLAQTIASGSQFRVYYDSVEQIEKTVFTGNLNQIVTQSDYSVVFYDDSLSFNTCAATQLTGFKTTYDTTLGWILGFHLNTEYNLSSTNVLVADSCINTTVYSYFYVIMEDYCLNRVDDTAITIAASDKHITLPSYALKYYGRACEDGTRMITGVPDSQDKNQNCLTQNQVFAAMQIANAALDPFTVESNKYAVGISIPNVFAHVPLNLQNITYGNTYVNNSNYLQTQERRYTVASPLSRLAVQLRDSKGNLVDLNGSEWSFTFIVEYAIPVNET